MAWQLFWHQEMLLLVKKQLRSYKKEVWMCSSISWILWAFHQSKCSLNGFNKTMVVQISWYGVNSMAFTSGVFFPVIHSVLCSVVYVELVLPIARSFFCLCVLLCLFHFFLFLSFGNGLRFHWRRKQLTLGMNFWISIVRKPSLSNKENVVSEHRKVYEGHVNLFF